MRINICTAKTIQNKLIVQFILLSVRSAQWMNKLDVGYEKMCWRLYKATFYVIFRARFNFLNTCSDINLSIGDFATILRRILVFSTSDMHTLCEESAHKLTCSSMSAVQSLWMILTH